MYFEILKKKKPTTEAQRGKGGLVGGRGRTWTGPDDTEAGDI
jgi:hypothetical protein